MRKLATLACALTFVTPLGFAGDLGFSGDKLVEPNCSAMSR
jgi:hypothetical protein